MIPLLAIVRLTVNIARDPAFGGCNWDGQLKAGDVGTVVELLPHDEYLVEFVNPDGTTRWVGDLKEREIELVQAWRRHDV